jgi:hypothetical protein
MTNPLGELKQINVREQWPDEPKDFTPWLAQEENIARLGAAIGIDLEVESTEAAAGPYSADILARDTITSDYVVIENQLGRTDHDHLGKSITYAAVLNASTIVWIAGNFTEEHKKALDWLNDNSSNDISYFGVGLELWQIDDSSPAVRFNVISRPAEFARRSAAKILNKELSESQKLQLDWWTEFREALLDRTDLSSSQQPRPSGGYSVALGRAGVSINCRVSMYDNSLAVRIYMQNKYNSESALSQLIAQKDKIEAEIGESLLWDAVPDASDKVIAITREGDISRKANWRENMEWMVEMTKKFRTVFRPRVLQLDLSATPEDTEGVG